MPEITGIEQAGAQSVRAPSSADWILVDPGHAWVSGDTYGVPEGGTAVRAGLGGVWISYFAEDRAVRVDPETGEIVSEIDVGSGPRFVDVGEGGVWVMNQSDGSVSPVDPTSDTVVATIPVDAGEIFGGDVTVGAGFVWLRASAELVAQIDPATDRVVARIGPAQASGGAHADDGRLWIADHLEKARGWRAVLYRIPLKDG